MSQRKLRRLVSRLKGCLSSLAPRQTEVLVLRTGLGLKHAYTRRQVARILHVSLPQEGNIERQAVAGLNSAAAGGRCTSTPTSVRKAVARTVGLLLALTNQLASTGSTPTGASPGTRQRAQHDPQAQGRPLQRPAARRPSSRFKSASIAPPEHGGLDWLLLLLALLIAAARSRSGW